MTKTLDDLTAKTEFHLESRTDDHAKLILARLGRLLFTHRLELGLGVTAIAVPFVRPTIATTPAAVWLKGGGLCLVLAGLGLRMWAAGFAGRHTHSQKIEGSKLAIAGPYAHVRNPIYLGSVILGFGTVVLIGDRRLLLPCTLTFLALYLGLIPAEEEFLSGKFQHEYETYCRRVPRLFPWFTAWKKAVKVPFDWRGACGEWRVGLVLAIILGVFRALATLTSSKSQKSRQPCSDVLLAA